MLKTIKSIKELIDLASRECGLECYIALNYGVKSSKFIVYNKDKKKPFHIFNNVDGTEQRLTKKELMDKGITNVGYAISRNALVAEN